MSTPRKFNGRSLFAAFTCKINELQAVLGEFQVSISPGASPESICDALLDADQIPDELTALLHNLHELSTADGLEHIASAIERFGVVAPIIEQGITPAVAALRLRNANEEAFRYALDRLLAFGFQGSAVALYHGRSARPITDEDAAAAGFEHELGVRISNWSDAAGFLVRPYTDGHRLVMLVFCERTAEVQLEFDHSRRTVESCIRKRVMQDMVLYDQRTGELEVEASSDKHREILREAFAVGVMRDGGFFDTSAEGRVLTLHHLARNGFSLPVPQGSGHTAIITGITVKQLDGNKPITIGFGGNRRDVIEFIRNRGCMRMIEGGWISKVRIDLVLGPRRMDRKSIELSGNNRIKFNRSTHAEDVYQYLRDWSLLEQLHMENQSAA
jgi:hypothetical protein